MPLRDRRLGMRSGFEIPPFNRECVLVRDLLGVRSVCLNTPIRLGDTRGSPDKHRQVFVLYVDFPPFENVSCKECGRDVSGSNHSHCFSLSRFLALTLRSQRSTPSHQLMPSRQEPNNSFRRLPACQQYYYSAYLPGEHLMDQHNHELHALHSCDLRRLRRPGKPVIDRGHRRYVVMLGGLMVTFGYMMTSLCH